jgi:hypothetical protein
VADWVAISQVATAGGTMILAVATFASIKSSNRSARVAERALLAGTRPILIPSREDDPAERIAFGDKVVLTVSGHGGARELREGNIYMAIGLRNGGAGVAVIHWWLARHRERTDSVRPDLDDFRRQQRDLYIPAGESGFWQGAVRDQDDPDYDGLRAAIERGGRVMIDLLYGDHEGGQRSIVRFSITNRPEVDGERADVLRYWSVDGDDPRRGA